MKKNFLLLITLLTINICYSIDINIPIIDKHIDIDIGPEPSELMKWTARNVDKITSAITESVDKLNIWKERAKKLAKEIPENVPYNYDELLSVDNQNFFTRINGNATQIHVGKIKNKMSVWMIGEDKIPYEYNPSNRDHNLSWIKQSNHIGVTKIVIAEDGTLAGINENGNVVLRQNEKWAVINDDKAKDIGIANNKEIIYLNEENKIYKSTDSGKSWNSLPKLDDEINNISIGADGTIVAATRENKAYYFDDKRWNNIPGEIKKIAVGSKTNICGISKDDFLAIYDSNLNKWKYQKNLIINNSNNDKAIKVKDVSINSNGNIWAILIDNQIITNIAANTNAALKKLKPEAIVTIGSLSENRLLRVETKTKNYIKPVGTDPEDENTQFKIIRSGQYFGLQSLVNNQFVTCDPNEGIAEHKGSIKLSTNFGINERWLIKGDIDQATLTSNANKKNLSFIDLETIVTVLKEEQMKQIEKSHGEMQAEFVATGTAAGVTAGATGGAVAGAVVGMVVAGAIGSTIPIAGTAIGMVIGGVIGTAVGTVVGGAIGGATGAAVTAALVGTAIEFQKQRTVAELEDLANPVLNNPGLNGKIVMAYLMQIGEEEEEFLAALFDVQVQKTKIKKGLSTENDNFKEDYKFDIQGHGYVKFKAKGFPIKFWLWDDKKKLILPGIIGGKNNKTVSLGTKKGWVTFAQKDEILKPETSEHYWVSINNQKITFGLGSQIDVDSIGTSKKIKEFSKVKYITFSKLPGSKAEMSEVKFYSRLLGQKPKTMMDKIKGVAKKTKREVVRIKNKIKPKTEEIKKVEEIKIKVEEPGFAKAMPGTYEGI